MVLEKLSESCPGLAGNEGQARLETNPGESKNIAREPLEADDDEGERADKYWDALQVCVGDARDFTERPEAWGGERRTQHWMSHTQGAGGSR